jgi:glycosyltransferase involved in cell wall biosynthesis
MRRGGRIPNPRDACAAGGRLIRVVYLVSTLRRAGPTTQLLNLLRHLDAGLFDPVVVTLSPEPEDSMLPEFRALGIPVRTLAMSRLAGLVNRGWRGDVERLLGERLDASTVVHSQGVRGDVIAARYFGGIPRVATARNFPHDDYPLKFGRLAGHWMAHSHLAAFGKLPNVVACSSTLAGLLRARRIAAGVIPNGVDTATFRPAGAAERADLRASLRLPAAARIGVSVGALSARKDPLLVIRAFRAVRNPGLSLVFLGGGPLAAACRQAAQGDARIRFEGQVADVTPYLRAADFLVSASKSEGLPNAVLEAMACGLRVALTDIGPHRELIELAPALGDVVPVGDEHALALAMERLAAAAPAADATPDAGLLERLGAKRMSRRYQEIYLHIAGARAAA